jgi:hypothetical protein
MRLRMALKQLLRRLQSVTPGARLFRGLRTRRRWPLLFGEGERLAVLPWRESGDMFTHAPAMARDAAGSPWAPGDDDRAPD